MKRLCALASVLVFLLCGCAQETWSEDDRCSRCRENCDYNMMAYTEDGMLCGACFAESNYRFCRACGELYNHDSFETLCGYCWDCTEEFVWWCSGCEEAFPVASMAEIVEGYFLCGSCTLQCLTEVGYDEAVARIAEESSFYPRG